MMPACPLNMEFLTTETDGISTFNDLGKSTLIMFQGLQKDDRVPDI